jgi:flagellar basal-body rod protein FlgB
MLEGINLFRLAGDRLQYLSERQSVIARNIANADTPGYVARDLAPFSFEGTLASQTGPAGGTTQSLGLTRTAGAHLTAAQATFGGPHVVAPSDTNEKPDGNHVSIEEQMVKAADNTNAYALVSAAYAKSISIMKLSIDK